MSIKLETPKTARMKVEELHSCFKRQLGKNSTVHHKAGNQWSGGLSSANEEKKFP